MNLHTLSRVFTAVASLAGFFCLQISTNAQQPRSISVVGSGTASMSPTHVLLRGRIDGSGDTSNEAYEDFRKEKTKIAEKLRDTADGKIRVEYEGEKLTTPSAMMDAGLMAFPDGGIEEAAAAETFNVIESVLFKVEIENDMEREQIYGQVTKLLDRAKQMGVKFVEPYNEMAMTYGFGSGMSGLAQFVISKPADLRMEAYEVAVDDARVRAERLAKLAGGNIGRVVSIEELALGDANDDQTQLLMQMYMGYSTAQPAQFSSDQNRKISVEQKLKVVFELTD